MSDSIAALSEALCKSEEFVSRVEKAVLRFTSTKRSLEEAVGNISSIRDLDAVVAHLGSCPVEKMRKLARECFEVDWRDVLAELVAESDKVYSGPFLLYTTLFEGELAVTLRNPETANEHSRFADIGDKDEFVTRRLHGRDAAVEEMRLEIPVRELVPLLQKEFEPKLERYLALTVNERQCQTFAEYCAAWTENHDYVLSRIVQNFLYGEVRYPFERKPFEAQPLLPEGIETVEDVHDAMEQVVPQL
jgi:hypothetical protein